MSTPELLSGSWTYRRFNPAFVSGNQTPEEKTLIVADGVLTLNTDATNPALTGLVGTIEWQGGGLDLRGTVRGGGDIVGMVGTGRPGTGTDGWEYRYDGRLISRWAHASDERPIIVGSVIRAKPHGDRKAGEVFSFIAVRPRPPDPNEPWHFPAMWTYRSFRNERKYPYLTAQPTARGLILQEAVLKLETPTSTTLRGTLEWQGSGIDPITWQSGGLDLGPGTVQTGVGGEPSSFDTVGWGRMGTSTENTEYHYRGHLTRNWPNEDPWGVADQRPALVGSVIILAEPRGPVGSVYPFIAVQQMTLNSTAFQQGDDIPPKYTCVGEAGIKNVSPPLAWEGVPNGAKSLVLIMDDFDAPDFVHWVVYNIPPDTKSLPENAARAGLPQGALHGLNDWADRQPPDPRATGYGGPCPPEGERHRYFHKLYALDIMLDLRGATKPQIEQAMRGHVLANAELIGRYPPVRV